MVLSHLLFDLDGTLTDPSEGITRCYIHALQAVGRVPPEAATLLRYIGPPVREVVAELLETGDAEEVERIVRIYRERFAVVGLFENVPYAGIAEVLAQLKAAGFTLWVCTSKPEIYARRILSHFQLSEYFAQVYGCELDGTRGDKADLMEYLLAREAIDPRAAVMIGDRLHDVRAARRSGLRSIGVLYGFGNQAELTEAGADALCASVADLPAAIDQVSRLR